MLINPHKLEELPTICGEDGWDSYGAKAVTKRAVEMAKTVADALPDFNWYACPTVDGGVQLEAETETESIEIEINIFPKEDEDG